MDQALALEEIISGIITALIDGEPGKMSRSDEAVLATVALVSRSFSKEALKELWRTSYSLVPLIQCFPEGVWEVREGKLYFLRPPLPDEWQRFNYYAGMIRSLKLRDEALKMDIPNVFTDLSLFRQSEGPLLPNLEHLHISESSTEVDILRFARLLCASRMKSWKSLTLCIPNSTYTPGGHAFLLSMPKLCPLLQGLTILPSGDHSGWDTFMTILPHFTALRKLSCRLPLTDEALMHIALFKGLVDLNITLPTAQIQLPSSEVMFPSLKKLTVIASEPQTAVRFLEAIKSTALKKLCLRLRSYSTSTALAAVFGAIPRGSVTSLRTLSIMDAAPSHTDHLAPMCTATVHSTLESLSAFRGLQNLEFNMSQVTLDLDDEGLSLLADWWPEMRCLSLFAVLEHSSVTVTLKALSQYITQCQQLRRAAMGGVDALVIPARPVKHNVNFDDLWLCAHSPIREVYSVAVFLSSIAPNLTWIDNTTGMDEWDIVRHGIAVLALAKEQAKE